MCVELIFEGLQKRIDVAYFAKQEFGFLCILQKIGVLEAFFWKNIQSIQKIETNHGEG